MPPDRRRQGQEDPMTVITIERTYPATPRARVGALDDARGNRAVVAPDGFEAKVAKLELEPGGAAPFADCNCAGTDRVHEERGSAVGQSRPEALHPGRAWAAGPVRVRKRASLSPRRSARAPIARPTGSPRAGLLPERADHLASRARSYGAPTARASSRTPLRPPRRPPRARSSSWGRPAHS